MIELLLERDGYWFDWCCLAGKDEKICIWLWMTSETRKND